MSKSVEKYPMIEQGNTIATVVGQLLANTWNCIFLFKKAFQAWQSECLISVRYWDLK